MRYLILDKSKYNNYFAFISKYNNFCGLKISNKHTKRSNSPENTLEESILRGHQRLSCLHQSRSSSDESLKIKDNFVKDFGYKEVNPYNNRFARVCCASVSEFEVYESSVILCFVRVLMK